jgi:hypothetical protein
MSDKPKQNKNKAKDRKRKKKMIRKTARSMKEMEMKMESVQAKLSLHCPLFIWRRPRRPFSVEPNQVLVRNC